MGTKRSIVIIPGAGDCAEVWEGVAATVRASGIACRTVDLPMHGSNMDPQPDSIESYADWVETFLTTEHLRDVVLAGHSMGSLIALEVASRRNDRLAEVILMSVGYPMAVAPFLLEMAATDATEANAFIEKYSNSEVTSDEIEDRRRRHHALRLQGSEAVITTDLHACNNYRRSLGAAAIIGIPTMVVLGEHDRMVPPDLAAPIIEVLSDVETVVLEKTGHAIQDEGPEEVAAILMAVATR